MATNDPLGILEYVDNINYNAQSWTSALDNITRDSSALDGDLEAGIQAILLDEFSDAIRSVDEYASNEVLADHLLNNIAMGPHVIVKNGVILQVFNTEYAGTWADVKEGQEAAWALSSKSPSRDPHWRSFWWRIIYTGTTPRKLVWKSFDPDLYNDIIQARLAAWGEKAPYWIFLEYGTSSGAGSGGTPYPDFPPQRPVYKAQQKAKDWVSLTIREYIDSVDETLSVHIDEMFVDNRLTTSKIIHDIDTTWTKVFKRGKYLVQLEQRRGRFTGQQRIIGPAE